jgi:transcriptional regulator with XRE-family HTH domain
MIKEKIINNIKTIRESKNFTEDYIAEQMGISQSSYNRKENGHSDFSLSEILKLGEVLEVPPSRFIDMDLEKIINNPQFYDTAISNGNSGVIENYTNNSNDEGYKTAIAQCQAEISFLRAQVEKLTDALAGK